MRKISLRILFLILVCFTYFQGCSPDSIRNGHEIGVLQPLSLSQVRLYGELGARYQAATCNLLTRTDRYSAEPSSQTLNALEPISAHWLVPAMSRILYADVFCSKQI